MGVYLNPGLDRYEEAIKAEIYVDKTEMIRYLNSVIGTSQKYVAVSRPRRFGKTMAADMISAYYDCSVDSRDIFEGRKLRKAEGKQPWDIYLNKFHVIHLNMIDFATEAGSAEEMLSFLEKDVEGELMEMWPETRQDPINRLRLALEKIHKRERVKFVFVIDEWDCVFRKFKDDAEGQIKYLDFMRNLLKDKSYVALAYITGILPIKKYGEHSALNMFTEYSMLQPQQMAEYAGFTDDEVRDLCAKHRRCYEDIRDWYDGYMLNGIVPEGAEKALRYEIYNPFSVVQAVTTGNIQDYWNATETFEALSVHINRNFSGLKDMVMLMMKGKRISINTRKYQNDMSSMASADDVLTLMIHLGYLAYDSKRKEAYLPNREILDEFENTVRETEEWDQIYAVLARSQKLLEATWREDGKEVARLVEDAHMRAGNMTYNSEAALSYAVRLAYFNAEQYYTLIPEMQAGKGYADLIYIPSPRHPNKPALLVELKWNQDAETAMTQILDMRYPDALEKYKGNIILVAISYDKVAGSRKKEYKKHECWIGRA